MNDQASRIQQQLRKFAAEGHTILVTGANGFVGKAVCRKLADYGIAVVASDLALPGESIHANMHHVAADVTDSSAVDALFAGRNISHVIHGGGISGPAVAAGNPWLIHHVNVLGSLNLLDAAKRHDVQRFVLLSSIAAYGDHGGNAPVDEGAALLATDFYGASKASAERIAASYRHSCGLPVVSLRLASIYGAERQVPCVIGNLHRSAHGGPAAVVSAPLRNPRQLIHIDDCVDAIVLALTSATASGPAYNIATGECVSETLIAQATQRLDPRVSYAVDESEQFFDCRIGPLRVEAARQDLGFAAQIDLAEGLRRYWNGKQALTSQVFPAPQRL